MAALPQSLRRTVERHPGLGQVLLGCGVASSLWWAAADILASRRYPGYSFADQTISELSAEGAPTRRFLMAVNAVPHDLLAAAFGLGVWASAGPQRAGRVTGALLAGSAVIDLPGGVLFPMQVRGTTGTLRNALHVPYGAIDVLLFLAAMGFGSTMLGRRFRYYSYGTVATLLVSGVLTGLQSGNMVKGQRTPWMGIEERIGVYATMLWLAVLAIGLLRAPGALAPGDPQKPARTA